MRNKCRIEKWYYCTEKDNESDYYTFLEDYSDYIESLPYPQQLIDVTPSSPHGEHYSDAYKLIKWRPIMSREEDFMTVRIEGWLYQSYAPYDHYWGFCGPPWGKNVSRERRKSLLWVLRHCFPHMSRDYFKECIQRAKMVSHGSDFDLSQTPCKSCIQLNIGGWRGPEWDIHHEYHDGLCEHLDRIMKLLYS